MERKNLIGITRASMRSSKSLKKPFRNSKALLEIKSGKSSMSRAGIKKSNGFKKRKGVNLQNRVFKDSVKLRKAGIKSKLNKKVTKSKNGSKSRRNAKNKENNINGILRKANDGKNSIRRPFMNLEAGVFAVKANNSKKSKKGSQKGSRLPFGAIIEDLSGEMAFENSISTEISENLIESENEEIQSQNVMQIEIKGDSEGVTQLYGDILNYIMSAQVKIFHFKS